MSAEVLKIGRVVEVTGSKIIGALDAGIDELYRTHKSSQYTVGQIGSIVKIQVGYKLVFGTVTALRMNELPFDPKSKKKEEPLPPSDAKWIEISLFGEGAISGAEANDFQFRRGVAAFPLPGQTIYVASVEELQRIYQQPEKPSMQIGQLSQANALPVHLLIDDMLGKHFAVLGTTGAGKSCSATVLLHALLKQSPAAHIILLDPHDEYAAAFGDKAEIIDPTKIDLPYWLLNFEESVELFTGRSEKSASNLAAILRDEITGARKQFCKEIDDFSYLTQITVDTPVPYDMRVLKASLKTTEDTKKSDTAKGPYQKLRSKIESLEKDARLKFLMCPDQDQEDLLVDLLAKLFRIPTNDKPLTIINMSGIPSGVSDLVVSMLTRIMFDFVLWGPRPPQTPLLLVCEEAHRYMMKGEDGTIRSTQKSLARIAKEGRKYGVGLGLVSQRPSELDDTILAQCNTIIALRMSNDQDQNFVRRALPDTVSSMVDMLPSLLTQEALVVGEGTVVPARVRFNTLSENQRPRSADVKFHELWQADNANEDYVTTVVANWRQQDNLAQPEAEHVEDEMGEADG